jgi:hypothetical protein
MNTGTPLSSAVFDGRACMVEPDGAADLVAMRAAMASRSSTAPCASSCGSAPGRCSSYPSMIMEISGLR